ncbi:MAG: BACON domain-containing protein [Bacteroidales bacterium]
MKHLFLVLFLSISFSIGAQEWLKPTRNNEQVTFIEEQAMFNDFCIKNNIVKGKYPNGKKLPGWKQFKRREYSWNSRINDKAGKLSNYQELVIRKNTRENSNSNWTSIGTNSSSGGYAGIGRVNVIAFHPTDKNTLFIGAPGGGLWKSTDNGVNWTPLTDNLASVGISDIYVHPDYAKNNTIYIATGDRDAKDTPSVGILKSTDGGNSWEYTGLQFDPSDEIQVNRLLGNPNNPDKLYAATTDGFYTSDDKGATWDKRSTTFFNDIEFNTSNPDILYGGSSAYYTSEIYKSIDGGKNWKSVCDTKGRRIALAVSADDSKIVYAVATNAQGGLKGIFKSTDSGDNFKQILNPTGANDYLLNYSCEGTGDNNGQGFYDLAIASNPTNANEVYVGGVNTWKTEDGGNNWKICSHWAGQCGIIAVHADKHELVFRPGTSEIFEGNDGGIYKSLDKGITWIDLSNTLVISQIYKIGIDAVNPGNCINGLQDNGTKIRQNNKYFDVIGGDGMECIIDASNPNIQYGSLYFGEIRKTRNNWNSQYNITPRNAGEGEWITPYVLDPQDQNIIYAGYSKLFKSINGGKTWTSFANTQSFSKISCLAVSPSDQQTIVFSRKGYLYKTNNGGNKWDRIDSKLPRYIDISYISIKHNDPNTIWVSGKKYDNNGVFQTKDGGKTWINISKGIPQIPVNCIVENKSNTNQVELYAGTYFGVYVKVDNADWELYSKNLPNTRVTELEIFYGNTPKENKIYAATYGRGLWTSPLNNASSKFLTISEQELSLEYKENTTKVNVLSNTTWAATCSEDWIILDKKSGDSDAEINITCKENTGDKVRKTNIVFTAPNNLSKTIQITQTSKDLHLEITPEKMTLPYKAGKSIAKVSCNLDWTASENIDWIKISPESGDTDTDLTIEYQENSGSKSRKGNIKIVAGSLKKTIEITQETKNVGIDELEKRAPIVVPNPAKNSVSINCGKDALYSIVRDVKGIPIWSKPNPNEKENIDTRNWKPGSYFIQIIKNDITLREILIIKK